MTLNKVQEEMIEADFAQEIADATAVANSHASRHLPGGADPLDVDKLIVSHKTVYVSSNGNDSNVGSDVSPFKTIGKALSVMKKVQQGNRSIILKDAGPFVLPEISSFVHGLLTIVSTNTSGSTITVSEANRVNMYECSTKVRLEKLNFDIQYDGTTFNSDFMLLRDMPDITLNKCVAEVTLAVGGYLKGLVIARSSVSIHECTLSGFTTAIQAGGASILDLSSCEGINNKTAIESDSSIVFKRISTITGDIAESKLGGGQIFS